MNTAHPGSSADQVSLPTPGRQSRARRQASAALCRGPMLRWKATRQILPLILVAAPAAPAQPDAAAIRESVVQVAVMDGDEVERFGSGFVVAEDGYLLTAAHLVQGEDLILAIPLAMRTPLLARVAHADEQTDLALLRVSGLALPPLTFARDDVEPGRRVFSAGIWADSGNPVFLPDADADPPLALAEGAVGRSASRASSARSTPLTLIEHNAMIPIAGYGGPLLNECGEIVGLNRGAPDVSTRQLRRGRAPDGVVHALSRAEVVALVRGQGGEIVESAAPCASAVEVAEAEAAEAAEQRDEARQERESATAQLDETREQLERAQENLDQAAVREDEAESQLRDLEEEYESAVRAGDAAASELGRQVQAARDRLEAERTTTTALIDELAALREQHRSLEEREAATRSRLMLVAGAAALAALLAIGAFFSYRRRSVQLALARRDAAQAQREAAAAETRAESTFPDCLLTGEAGGGRPVSIKIPGALLGGKGAVIGRSARKATLLIDDSTMSREHARLFAEGESLYLEDLGATNGTTVNGRVVGPRSRVVVRDGDGIEFGGVKVELAVAD